MEIVLLVAQLIFGVVGVAASLFGLFAWGWIAGYSYREKIERK